MKKITIYLFLAGMLTGFTSCFQEDEPVPPYESPDGVVTGVAELGGDYAKQVFYDLKTNQFVRSVHRESWDLAFQCGAADYHIFTNSSKLMRIGHTGIQDFNAVTSTESVHTWDYDRSEGWADSTAFGEWGTVSGNDVISSGMVYIVDRGSTTTGSSAGMKKIMIQELVSGSYKVRFANLDGSAELSKTISKNEAYNYAFLSLTDGALVDVEPPKDSWDLQFTQYTTLVEQNGTGIIEQYSVNGVLLNSYRVEGARDFDKGFTDISYADLSSYTFTGQRDIIGYQWKEYDFENSVYVIYNGQNYLLKDVEGNFYKLRFTGFTNAQGIKGHPTFEVARF